MSPILLAKKAAERKLSTLSPALPTAYEGIKFIPPAGMYLRTQFSIQRPDDPVIGDKYYRERISLQVFVVDILNTGTANAYAKADEIRTLFEKGSTFQEQGTNIYVLSTPQITGAAVASDRLIVPVIVELVVEVYKD